MIDVSDLLTDPDFVRPNALTCLRNTQTVGANGLASNSQQSIPFTGTVSANRKSLSRRAEGERIGGDITVFTMFALIDGQAGSDADIVVWNGQQYTVTLVNSYAQFGRGHVEAVCELLPLSG